MGKTIFRHLLVLLLLSAAFISEAKLLDRVVAIVDDTPVLESDIKTMMSQLKKNSDLANLYGLRDKAINRKNVMDKIIEEKIIRVSLKNLNAEVSDGEVAAQIKGIAEQNGVSTNGLRASLEQDGVPFVAYRRSIRTQLERRRIFDREVRKTAGSISDLELRNEFMRNAPEEYLVGMVADTNNASNKKLLTEISSKVNKGQLPLIKVKEHPNYQELGWLAPGSVNPVFRAALKKTSVGRSTKTIVADNRIHVLVVHSSRKGSDEQFEAQKERIRNQITSRDYESRFDNWVAKKKVDLQVVVNK
jgi:parvulin-like peptidyl-prolyl isomerase